MVANEVASFPEEFAGLGIEAGCARGTEGNVDAAILDDGCGRAVGVELVGKLGIGNFEEFDVVNDLPGFGIDADRGKLLAILGGSSHPDLAIKNNGRGPGASVNGGFPGDVGIFRPLRWKVGGFSLGCDPLPCRSSELRPICIGGKGEPCEEDRDEWKFHGLKVASFWENGRGKKGVGFK